MREEAQAGKHVVMPERHRAEQEEALTRCGPVPLVQSLLYAVRTNVQVLFYTIPKKRNPAALWGRAAGNPKKKG